MSWFTPAVAVGAVIVAGTVVAVTVVVDEASEVPVALLAVTLTVYVTPEAKPVTVIGDVAPVAVLVVCPPAVAVTVKDVAAGDSAGNENDTEAAPSLNGRFVPTLVALTLVGASGCKKSFCAADLFPALLFTAI